MPIIEIKRDLDVYGQSIVGRINNETAAEIARVENYLNSLRKLQIAIDPKPKKRKYTKRKVGKQNYDFIEEIGKLVASGREPVFMSPPAISKYTVKYNITDANIKKSRSRKKVV